MESCQPIKRLKKMKKLSTFKVPSKPYNLWTWFRQFLKLTVLEALRVVPRCRISSNRDVNTPHSVTVAMSLLEDGMCCGEMLAALLLC
jgi:hypothetical protein